MRARVASEGFLSRNGVAEGLWIKPVASAQAGGLICHTIRVNTRGLYMTQIVTQNGFQFSSLPLSLTSGCLSIMLGALCSKEVHISTNASNGVQGAGVRQASFVSQKTPIDTLPKCFIVTQINSDVYDTLLCMSNRVFCHTARGSTA